MILHSTSNSFFFPPINHSSSANNNYPNLTGPGQRNQLDELTPFPDSLNIHQPSGPAWLDSGGCEILWFLLRKCSLCLRRNLRLLTAAFRRSGELECGLVWPGETPCTTDQPPPACSDAYRPLLPGVKGHKSIRVITKQVSVSSKTVERFGCPLFSEKHKYFRKRGDLVIVIDCKQPRDMERGSVLKSCNPNLHGGTSPDPRSASCSSSTKSTAVIRIIWFSTSLLTHYWWTDNCDTYDSGGNMFHFTEYFQQMQGW